MFEPSATPGADYTSVDLNSTGTTDLYDSARAAAIYGVHLRNGGTSAVANLEITDGTDTATVVNNRGSGGSDIHFDGPLELSANEKLQVNVTTAEGAAQTNTAVVIRSEE